MEPVKQPPISLSGKTTRKPRRGSLTARSIGLAATLLLATSALGCDGPTATADNDILGAQAFEVNDASRPDSDDNRNKPNSASEDAADSGKTAAVSSDVLASVNSEYVRLENSQGTLIAERKSRERLYPASMTKIMTALVAAERIEDLDEPIRLTNDDFLGLFENDASLAGFLPGETLTARELLFGAILPSGAECCQALAARAAGSTEQFVELMNERALELGMEDTRFANVTGLHDEEHYTTASDMTKLLWEALENQDVRQVLLTLQHHVPPTDQHESGLDLHSTLTKTLASPEVPGGRILGGKTGYTQEAGLCLASVADIGGETYVLVTAHAPGDSHGTGHTEDAVALYSSLGR